MFGSTREAIPNTESLYLSQIQRLLFSESKVCFFKKRDIMQLDLANN